VSIYPIYALQRGQLSLLWSTLLWQFFNRPSSGSLLNTSSVTYSMVHGWVTTDPWLLVTGFVAAVLMMGSRRLRPFAFALLLLVVSGLLLSGSGFALMALGGDRSLLPMSLIVIATICMTWTLRHWTTISMRRALLALVISLSASWITALACVQGMSRREGVFLRTSKTGSTHRRIRTAFRLSRWETLLANALFVSAGLLSASRHVPIFLTVILCIQGAVYLCSPISSFWNLRAQRVPGFEYRRRFEERRLHAANRVRPSFRPIGIAALLLALLVGLAAAMFAAPARLLPATRTQHVRVDAPVRVLESVYRTVDPSRTELRITGAHRKAEHRAG